MAERNASNWCSRTTLDRRDYLSRTVAAGTGLGALLGGSDGVQAQSESQSNGGDKLWSFTAGYWGHNIWASPTVVDGTVYVGIQDEGSEMFALDASDGAKKWKWAIPDGGVGSSANVVDGTVYVGSNDGKLYAVDAESATTEWQFEINTPDLIFSSPTVYKGTVYVGSGNDDSTLYAVNAATGEKEWEYTQIGGIFSSPLVHNGMVFIGSNADNFQAIDAESGEQEWEFETGDVVWSSPTAANGKIFVGSHDNRLYALDQETGTEMWSFLAGGPVVSSPTVLGQTAYFGSKDGFVYAVDTETGDRKWGTDVGEKIRYSSPTVTDSLVFIGSADHDGKLFALDRMSGTEKWRLELDDAPAKSGRINSSPIVVDGTLFIGAGTSDANTSESLYAIDAGVNETSKGSRVAQGVLGHHDEWAEEASSLSPVADAGDSQTVDAGEDVVLDGTDSTNPSADPMEYQWEQIDGPEVELNDADTQVATFSAPVVPTESDLVFELTVDNGEATDSATTTVTTLPSEDALPPIVGESSPQDHDGDGLYEDINGDGEFDIIDVHAFMENYERFQSGGDLEEYAAAFDFNQSGSVDLTDVQKLYQMLD